MQFVLALILVLCALCTQGASEGGAQAQPVAVVVFYESLCPDSKRFFREQLQPTYGELADIMDVQLHAYGKVTEVQVRRDSYLFRCQHGPQECYGNKVLGCAKNVFPNQKDYVNFAICFMDSFDFNDQGSLAKCAPRQQEQINACASSKEGRDIHHAEGVIQNTGRQVTYIPRIEINGEHNKLSEYRLKAVVCSTYEGVLPPGCRGFITN